MNFRPICVDVSCAASPSAPLDLLELLAKFASGDVKQLWPPGKAFPDAFAIFSQMKMSSSSDKTTTLSCIHICFVAAATLQLVALE